MEGLVVLEIPDETCASGHLIRKLTSLLSRAPRVE